MILAWRNGFLLVAAGVLLLSLSVAPGCCKRCYGTREKAVPTDNTAGTDRAGVTVTEHVPRAGTTGFATDNAATAPSTLSIPRAIPIGKKPPPKVIPSAEDPQ